MAKNFNASANLLQALRILISASTTILSAAALAAELPAQATATTWCTGDYADDLSALTPAARELERQPSATFSYCVRSVATYECLSYSPDGTIARRRQRVTSHGTAFGLASRVAGETLLVTNQHVVDYPTVTDDRHHAGDVAPGCKRVADSVRIVDNESDEYDKDDIALQRVAVDPSLDLAVVKAKAVLRVMPWRIGNSGALKERNAVVVQGFPLGVMRTTTTGRVVSKLDHDDDKDWDHDDFVVDALLSSGNSGSPVLAVSCRTGEYELVGIYHAGYNNTPALNVVVAVDQARDFLTTFRRSPRAAVTVPLASDTAARTSLQARVRTEVSGFFALGERPAAVAARQDGSLLFAVYAKGFPDPGHPLFAVEDLPSPTPDRFGELGRIWLGGLSGLRSLAVVDLDAEGQKVVERLLDSLRSTSLLQLERRALLRLADSKEVRSQTDKLTRRLQRRNELTRLHLSPFDEWLDRLAPADEVSGLSLAQVVALKALPLPDQPTESTR